MDAQDNEDDAPEVLHLVLSKLNSLITLLQAIKVGAKQACCVTIDPEGVSIRWEDDSKTLQSSITLRSELFSSYEGAQQQQQRAFGVNLSQLVDTLSVFASASDAALHLRFPGPDGELQLEMCEGPNKEGSCVLYARVATLELPPPADLTDYWAEPVSYFLVKGSLLKEAVEDLEWPGGSVALQLVRDPSAVKMRASGTGSLEVQLDTSHLSSCQVSAAEVFQHYKYKNLRAALSNIPSARDIGGAVSTKVSIDANGLLKVTHMVPLAAGGGGSNAGAASSMPSVFSAFTSTQAADSSKLGVLQFVSLPVEDEE